MTPPHDTTEDAWMWTWKKRLLGLLMAVLAVGMAVLGLARKPKNPDPGPGTALPGGAMVAWSPGYRVSFFGVEHLHPFDSFKYDTIAMARHAREHGVGINLGGGYHHARPEGGHGFCVYNDVAVAVQVLRDDGFDGRVLIVDTDAHQGDGNHAAFDGDERVYTLSMQQEKIFPLPRVPGDRDVELPAGMDDGAYLKRLERELEDAFEAAQPDLVIHVAGSDPLWDDPLAGLGLSIEGLVQRDLAVLRATRSRSVPYLHLLAGGYGPSSAEASAKSVAAILREVAEG